MARRSIEVIINVEREHSLQVLAELAPESRWSELDFEAEEAIRAQLAPVVECYRGNPQVEITVSFRGATSTQNPQRLVEAARRALSGTIALSTGVNFET